MNLLKKKMDKLQTGGPLSTNANDISPMGEIEQSPTKSGFTVICVNNYFLREQLFWLCFIKAKGIPAKDFTFVRFRSSEKGQCHQNVV